jgi:drug/metabolite transporter (DMT)-like permease
VRPRFIPFALALAWGLNWPAVKIVLGALPPFTQRAIGLGGGALLLLLLAAVQRRALLPPRAHWPGILVAGGLTVAAFNFCTALAQLNTSTSRAAVITYTMPMLASALAWLLLGERPGRRGGLALALGAIGIALLAWPVWRRAAEGSLAGLVFPLLAALAWALGTIATKRWPAVPDRVVATAWQLAVGSGCGIVAAAAASGRLPPELPPLVSAALAYHAVIATALAYVLWYRLLDAMSATVSSLTTLAVPVVGVVGAMALVGDRPAALDWVGFVLVLAGAALVLVRPRAVA